MGHPSLRLAQRSAGRVATAGAFHGSAYAGSSRRWAERVHGLGARWCCHTVRRWRHGPPACACAAWCGRHRRRRHLALHEGVVPAARRLCRPRHAMDRPVAVRRVDVCRRSGPGHRDSTVVDTPPSSRPSHARRGAGRGHRGDRPCRLGDTVVLVPGVLTGRSADQVAAVAEIVPDPSR